MMQPRGGAKRKFGPESLASVFRRDELRPVTTDASTQQGFIVDRNIGLMNQATKVRE
jgi:hypothetical protein